MYSNSPTAMQNFKKSGGNTPDPCFEVGEGRGWGSLFLFSENVLTLSYGVGNAEFNFCCGGNTSDPRFRGEVGEGEVAFS